MGARYEFGILGPLEVRCDGAAVAVGGPRQRALLALLLCNANRVLSRDRLIDELLPDRNGRSPERMLRVQVSRLRKALSAGGDETRVIARPPGYLLRVEPGELDLEAFEALVAQGQASLQSEDPARAAALLRRAEGLWRGEPLADPEFEPFARFEVQRLEELRLVALEERIEAELSLGRHAALCPELTTLTCEYPLRERLRGQLMLALYRSGRQADALAVYRQTGDLLREELGLDPSRTLRELERSILQQDDSLDGSPGPSVAIDAEAPVICPFKGLAFFDQSDADFFFGREPIVKDLLARAAESSLVGILGPSGIGKSSLLRAGVLPALGGGALPGSAGLRQVLLRPGEHPCEQLSRALGGAPLGEVLAGLSAGERLVLAVDQLEELFTACEREDERSVFLEALFEAACDDRRRALVLVALRGDFYVRFASHPRFAELLSANHILVGPMDRAELRQAIEQPAARVWLEIERSLVDTLVSDAAGNTGGLPLLSAMLLELWHERDGRTLRYESYRASGGMQAAVTRLAEAAYASLTERRRAVARSLLLRLVAERDGTLTRRRAPVAELERIDGANPVVAALIDARMLTISDGKVELSHEALVREWPRFRSWLEEDRAGRRLHAHLTAAAGDWDGRGRDPGELYRGARLATALDWAAHSSDRLDSLDREFLDRSRLESDREQRRQRAQNRRLRALLLAVAVLSLLAGGAALLARVKQQSASNQARAALARQLGAEAVNEPPLDLAMLMAAEAVNLDRSPQTQSTLLATLLRSPAVIGTIGLGANTTAALAFSPDDRTLAVGDSLGELRLFDAGTHAAAAPALGELSDSQPPIYSSDGTLLAYRAAGGCACNDFITVRAAHTLQQFATLALPGIAPPPPNEIPAGGIAISPDDRTVYYAYWDPGSAGRPPATYLQRWALPGGRALPAARVGSGALLAMRLVNAGSRIVFVGTRSLREFDARSLRMLRTVAITPAPAAPTTAAISPDGQAVVIGSNTGSVSFLDVSTGKLRAANAPPDAPAARVLFAPGGRTAVSIASDGVVTVWNPRKLTQLEALTGPRGPVEGAAISPDGRTLYTSSLYGLLLEWDLTATRGFGSRSPLGPRLACCGPIAPPAPPLALSPDGSRFATAVGPSRVGLFSVSTRERLAVFTVPARGAPITALAWSPRGDELAVGGHTGLAQLWTANGPPRLARSLPGLRSIFGEPEAVQAIAFSRDGRLVAATDDDRIGTDGAPTVDYAALAIWSSATGRLMASPASLNTGPAPGVAAAGDDLLAFSPNGKLLAVSVFDRSIQIRDASTARLVQVLPSDGGSTALTFAPDGTLANGTPAGTVELWNPVTGQQIGSPGVVSATPVTSVAFDPTGARFATAGLGEGIVKLWFAGTRQQQGPALPTDPGSTSAVAFAQHGRVLLAVDDHDTGFTWPAAPPVWQQLACRVAGRNLTRQEWSQLVVGHAYSTVCRSTT